MLLSTLEHTRQGLSILNQWHGCSQIRSVRALTVDVEQDPFADDGEDPVGGDAQEGPHVVATHFVEKEMFPGIFSH